MLQPYQARFIPENEFPRYGLPTKSQQPDIVTLVERASTFIDEFCARADTDGHGSLAWTTYEERLLLPVGRNLVRVSFRPMTAIDACTYSAMVASGSVNNQANYFYTGFVPNGTPLATNPNVLSPIVSCSGRYGYARRGQTQVYPDLNYAANVLQIASFFGGPPAWTNIDVASIDFDGRTGEVWMPAGLYLSQYTEIFIRYNSGFNPVQMPPAIKQGTTSLGRNVRSRGGGATGLKGFQAVRSRSECTEDLIDTNLQNLLQAYR